MQDTIFGKIARGEIAANLVYEDPKCVAFPDIAPAAPVHLLVIPREPFENILEADSETVAHVMKIAAQLGAQHCPDGFRLVTNTGKNGGQTVFHWHVHVLGGRELNWNF